MNFCIETNIICFVFSLRRFTQFHRCDAPDSEDSEETRFQEHAVVLENKNVNKEIPALCNDQKSSKISIKSDLNSHPSEEGIICTVSRLEQRCIGQHEQR